MFLKWKAELFSLWYEGLAIFSVSWPISPIIRYTSAPKHATTSPLLRDCSSKLGVAQDSLYWWGLHNTSFQEHKKLWKRGALLRETLFWRAIPNSLAISHLFFLCVYVRLFKQNSSQLITFCSPPHFPTCWIGRSWLKQRSFHILVWGCQLP